MEQLILCNETALLSTIVKMSPGTASYHMMTVEFLHDRGFIEEFDAFTHACRFINCLDGHPGLRFILDHTLCNALIHHAKRTLAQLSTQSDLLTSYLPLIWHIHWAKKKKLFKTFPNLLYFHWYHTVLCWILVLSLSICLIWVRVKLTLLLIVVFNLFSLFILYIWIKKKTSRREWSRNDRHQTSIEKIRNRHKIIPI